MRLIVPDYYQKFACIASRCTDSCCIGWQIEVDESQTVELCDNQRCPYLNEDNLCKKIIEKGEESLSEICARHPRYFEWFDDFLEGGIGLCCIEASRIILNNKVEKYIEIDFKEEGLEHDHQYYEYIDGIRKNFFSILSNDNFSIEEKLNQIFGSKIIIDYDKMIDFFLSLEIMSQDYKNRLEFIKENLKEIILIPNSKELEKYLSNIAVYFTWRYLIKTIFDDEFQKYQNIIVFSTKMIELLFKAEVFSSANNFAWWAKEYSKEVEYDEDNLQKFSQVDFLIV